MIKALSCLFIFCFPLFSCTENDSFASKISNVKRNTKGKKVNFFSNGNIHEVIDSNNADFLGSRFEFTDNGDLRQYSFLCDKIRASYIESYIDNKIETVEGSPIVYSLTSADKAKDSMYLKRFISILSYKNIKVDYSINDGEFISVDLIDEPELNFIKSFEKFVNTRNLNRFSFVTKFAGTRIDNNTTIVYYDTLDVTKKKQ